MGVESVPGEAVRELTQVEPGTDRPPGPRARCWSRATARTAPSSRGASCSRPTAHPAVGRGADGDQVAEARDSALRLAYVPDGMHPERYREVPKQSA